MNRYSYSIENVFCIPSVFEFCKDCFISMNDFHQSFEGFLSIVVSLELESIVVVLILGSKDDSSETSVSHHDVKSEESIVPSSVVI